MSKSHQPQGFQARWSAYYQAVEGRPPRETLLKALEYIESLASPIEPRFGVDLGCGDGRDTIELLRRGWQVLGIDGEAEAIARLRSRNDVVLEGLDTRVEQFEDLTLPESAFDLINASFCLPFCASEAFPQLWSTITNALRPNGIFCGHLFGDRDSWASLPGTHHLTRAQVEAMLLPFEIIWFMEEEHPGQTALNEDKYWHIFNIVARKH